MANTKSAEKRNIQAEKKRARNRAQRSRMRRAAREVRAAVDTGDKVKAEKLLADTLSLIDETAQKRIIHGNAAARTKSRLTRAVAAMQS